MNRCPVCGDAYRTMSELEEHHREVHLEEKTFTCPVCGSEFSWEKNLKRHMNMHQQQTYQCTQCSKGWYHTQELSQEMIKGSPNLLIVGPGQGLGSSHNAIWWNLAIFFYVQAENRSSKRRLDGSLAKFLIIPKVYNHSQCSVFDHTLKRGISNCARETLHH